MACESRGSLITDVFGGTKDLRPNAIIWNGAANGTYSHDGVIKQSPAKDGDYVRLNGVKYKVVSEPSGFVAAVWYDTPAEAISDNIGKYGGISKVIVAGNRGKYAVLAA